MIGSDMLAEGIAAARAGRRAEARSALLQALEADDRNESAWLWLSGVMETPEERRICLENVLAVNPANAHARRGLELLGRQHPPARAAATATTTIAGQLDAPPIAPPAAPPAPADEPPTTGATLHLPTGQAAPATHPAPAVAAESPATGATQRLPTGHELPQPAALPAPVGEPPPILSDAYDAEEPCPYCGAVTLQSQRSCRGCRRSLMVRLPPREHRSIALTIMAALYAVGSLFALLAGGLMMLALIGVAALGQAAGQDTSGPIAAVAGGVLLVVALCVGTTVGLFRRRRWAYIAHIISVVMTALSVIPLVLFAGAVGSMLLLIAGQAGAAAESAELMGAAGSIGGTVLCNVAMLAVWIVLTVLSHRDFYGPMARMSSAGITGSDDPYNAGIRYRNSGMWYMAAHEWERAARQAPRDVTVHHALGLAYAQLRRFDAALTALRTAHTLEPADPRIAADIALVEGLAAGK